MTTNIVRKLECEMCNCRACKIFNNKVKRANTSLPNEVIENILSFIKCKRCMMTLNVINTDFKIGCWNEMEISILCFIKLNPLPSRKTINEKCLFGNQNHPDYIVKRPTFDSGITYRRVKDYYLHINDFNVVFPDTCRRRMFRYIEFMFSDRYKKLNYSKIFDYQFFKSMKIYLDDRYEIRD